MAGLGLEPESPYAALQDLAETLGAPVVVTPKAKGAIPDNHPLAAGTVGLTRTDPVYTLVEKADCIVAVGFDVVELVKPWRVEAPLIWIAPWPDPDPVVPAVVEFAAALAPILQRLADGEPPAQVAGPNTWGADAVAELRRQLTAVHLAVPQPGRMLPQTVLTSLHAAVTSRSTGRRRRIAQDLRVAGMAHPYARSFPAFERPIQYGVPLPAAIAASLAIPGQPVLCLTGDAGLTMVAGELNVLRRLRCPVIVVVLNDGAIDLIRSQQMRAGKPVFGTEFPEVDFVALGVAFGIRSTRVDNKDSLAQALQSALAQPTPALIEVMLDPIGYPTTPPR